VPKVSIARDYKAVVVIMLEGGADTCWHHTRTALRGICTQNKRKRAGARIRTKGWRVGA